MGRQKKRNRLSEQLACKNCKNNYVQYHIGSFSTKETGFGKFSGHANSGDTLVSAGYWWAPFGPHNPTKTGMLQGVPKYSSLVFQNCKISIYESIFFAKNITKKTYRKFITGSLNWLYHILMFFYINWLYHKLIKRNVNKLYTINKCKRILRRIKER